MAATAAPLNVDTPKSGLGTLLYRPKPSTTTSNLSTSPSQKRLNYQGHVTSANVASGLFYSDLVAPSNQHWSLLNVLEPPFKGYPITL